MLDLSSTKIFHPLSDNVRDDGVSIYSGPAVILDVPGAAHGLRILDLGAGDDGVSSTTVVSDTHCALRSDIGYIDEQLAGHSDIQKSGSETCITSLIGGHSLSPAHQMRTR